MPAAIIQEHSQLLMDTGVRWKRVGIRAFRKEADIQREYFQRLLRLTLTNKGGIPKRLRQLRAVYLLFFELLTTSST